MKKEYHGITVNDMYNALYKQFNWLVDEILNYESDTFSASGEELTPAEAEKIALSIVYQDMEARREMRTMDGGMIAEELETIRA